MGVKKKESVFIAKCIGISLVVIGHYYPEQSPAFWISMRNIIYSFHMPLFFMISGYLYGLSHPRQSDYFHMLHNKVKRLLVPFISIAAFFYLIKSAAGLFFSLQNPVSISSLALLFVCPEHSYLPLLWFVYTLFLIFALFPIINMLTKYDLALFALVFLLAFIKWTDNFCLNLVFGNMPIFAIGYIAGRRDIDIDAIGNKNMALLLAASVLLFTAIHAFKGGAILPEELKPVMQVLVGFLGSLACICASSILSKYDDPIMKYIKLAGKHSMTIYLLHTLFSGVVRIGFYQVLKLPNSLFLLGAVMGIAAGIVIPIVIEKYFLLKYGLARKLFLGLA